MINKLTKSDMITAFASDSGIVKTAELLQGLIRTKIREGEITSAILPPVTPSMSDLQRSKTHDQLTVIIDVETEEGLAVELDLRSTGMAKYVTGNRIEVGFTHFGTEEYTKNEEEMYAYKYDLLEEVTKTAMLELSANVDRKFMEAITAVLTAPHTAVGVETFAYGQNSHVASAGTVKGFQREAFKELSQMFVVNKLRLNKILMNSFRFYDIFVWDATTVGDRIASDITENGYEKKNVLGLDFLLTIKDTISYKVGGIINSAGFVGKDDIYGFAAPEYFGVHLNNPAFGETKFFLEKRKGMVSWSAKRSLGMGFGNALGVCKYKVNLT